MSTHRPCRGFTLIELLVVISIIAVLAGLLLPAVVLVKNRANQTANGNSQKQIVTAIAAYQNDNNGAFPCVPIGVGGNPIDVVADDADPAEGRLVAYASLESLAALVQLPNGIFKAKGQTVPSVGGNGSAPPKLYTDPAFGNSPWSARNGGGEIAWAYDWSAGGEVASYRIILADRGNWHKSRVVAVAADTSLRLLSNAGTGSPGQTISMTPGVAVTAPDGGTAINPDALGCGSDGTTDPSTPDAVYTSDGDGGAQATAGNLRAAGGDIRRAWVK